MSEVESKPGILFSDILDKGHYLRLKVTGRSMRPFINSGSIVTLKKVECNTLQRWDIILYMNYNGSLVLHRIVKKEILPNGDLSFITRGDALIQKDRPATEEQILGKALWVEMDFPVLGPRKIRLDSLLCRSLNLLYGFYRNLRHRFFNRSALNMIFFSSQ